MGKKKLLLSISLALVLVTGGLVGCTLSTAATGSLEDITWIEDITWMLESYGEPENLQAVLEGTEITAIFDSAEGQVTGSAGCNSYFADYEASGSELSILELAWTEMGCPEPQGILEQETQYLQALQAAESYKIEDGKLQITSGNQVLIYRDSEEPIVSHGGPTSDYVSLVDNLRAAGATVEPAGEVINQPFFSVTGSIITVNGGDVQVFEYADAATAEAEAALVSPDGSSVGTSMVGWVASPHFYRVEKLIVLYVGDGEAVTAVLESVLGQQFAGRSGGLLEDITWVLESYGEAESLQTVLAGTEITALFDSGEGQISGSAGANNYFGGYQISKNKLSIQEIAHTEMYRLDPEGVMEQEDDYLKTLQGAESYEISVGKLQITSGNQVLIFRGNEE